MTNSISDINVICTHCNVSHQVKMWDYIGLQLWGGYHTMENAIKKGNIEQLMFACPSCDSNVLGGELKIIK